MSLDMVSLGCSTPHMGEHAVTPPTRRMILTCWSSASGPEYLATSLLPPPSTRRAVRPHWIFRVSPDPSVRCTHTIEASRRLDAMTVTVTARPVLPSHSLCLVFLRVRVNGPWSRSLFGVMLASRDTLLERSSCASSCPWLGVWPAAG